MQYWSAYKVTPFWREAPADNIESGQSQFAPPKLRSLALVPSSGALSRPSELHLWQLHCETVPSAPRRSSQRLAAVPQYRHNCN